jgi:hemerythrin-like domain-containing protein
MNVAILPTTPIRAEHGELLPQIEALAHTAAWMRDAPAPVVREKVNHAVEFLQHHLLPHAAAEEETLYEAVEGAFDAPGSTRTMQRDHVQIARMTEELAAVRDALEDPPSEQHRDRITQLLYGLHAIVTLHLSKEEEIYLPLLDEHLSDADAEVLIARMEEAEARHRPTPRG